MKEAIPVHKLTDRSVTGLEMMRIVDGEGELDERAPLGAHRDDHYIFLFQESGESDFMLDFRQMRLRGCGVLCILPGQVHHAVSAGSVTGWFLALDTMLVNEDYRKVFEQYLLINEPVILSEETKSRLNSCAHLLYEVYRHMEEPMSKQIAYGLVMSYIGIIAGAYLLRAKGEGTRNSRPQQISGQFRSLLLQNLKTVKSPVEYAEMMNISAPYLNEAVKKITGFTVSHLVHQELVLEAKRLLYYTDLSVKQIAFELGFNDHTYFSRLFTKVAGCSALQFRSGYRK